MVDCGSEDSCRCPLRSRRALPSRRGRPCGSSRWRSLGQSRRCWGLPQRLAFSHWGHPASFSFSGGARRGGICEFLGFWFLGFSVEGRGPCRPKLGSIVRNLLLLLRGPSRTLWNLHRPDLGGDDDRRNHSTLQRRQTAISLLSLGLLCRVLRSARAVLREDAERPRSGDCGGDRVCSGDGRWERLEYRQVEIRLQRRGDWCRRGRTLDDHGSKSSRCLADHRHRPSGISPTSRSRGGGRSSLFRCLPGASRNKRSRSRLRI